MSENLGRSRRFKNQGRDTEDGRRKRNDASVELRKVKKEDQLMKRRNVTDIDIEEPVSPLQERSGNVAKPAMPILPMPQIISYIKTDDREKQLHAALSARKILSREYSPPIEDFIQAGLVPRFVSLLGCHDSPSLQFESAWTLTNIASGNCDQTMTVVKAGGIPKFAALLKSPDCNVREQCVWALGNIAGDGPHLRDAVIEAGAIDSLIALVRPDTKVPLLRNIAWTLSNLCRNKNPSPSLQSCCRCLPVFAQFLCHDDAEVLGDTCWALSYITDGSDDKIQAVIDSGILPRVVSLLSHNETQVITPALRAIGNIVTGNDEQTQAVVNSPSCLQTLGHLLSHSKANIQKEAGWAISNITAGNQLQIQAVIDAEIIPGVISLMSNGDFKSQKEAVWVITNLTSGGTLQQIAYLVEVGVLAPLIGVMTAKEAKTVLVVLDAISNILRAASKYSEEAKRLLCIQFEELGGVDKLEMLQNHDNNEIYEYAQRLIDTFFSEDEADTDSAVAPTQDETQFGFVVPSGNEKGDNPPANFNF